MQAKIDLIFERGCRVVEIALAVAFLAAVCLNFINVLGRYLIGYSPAGIDEIQIYIMVWMAFVGAAIATWRNAHLRMDVLLQSLPGPMQTAARGLELAVFLVAAVFVALQSFYYASRMFKLGQVSDLAEIPTWIPHSAVVVGFGLMAAIVLWRVRGLSLDQKAADIAVQEEIAR